MHCIKNNRAVRDPEVGQFPSTFWLGDEFQCPACGHRMITQFGLPIDRNPIGQGDPEPLLFQYEPLGDRDPQEARRLPMGKW
jgi:hypothetical protein